MVQLVFWRLKLARRASTPVIFFGANTSRDSRVNCFITVQPKILRVDFVVWKLFDCCLSINQAFSRRGWFRRLELALILLKSRSLHCATRKVHSNDKKLKCLFVRVLKESGWGALVLRALLNQHLVLEQPELTLQKLPRVVCVWRRIVYLERFGQQTMVPAI